MYALVLAVVQCGKGDAEVVFVMLQADVRFVGKVLVDVLAVLRMCRLVMNLQVLEE